MKRTWTIAHALLTLASVACCVYLLLRPNPIPPGEDRPLRSLLSVKWLGGEYELPAGEEHCAVALLEFRNGVFHSRVRSAPWSVPKGESRVVPITALWHTNTPDDASTLVFWTPNTSSATKKQGFAKLSQGGYLRVHGSKSGEDWQGYRVIGLALSEALANDEGNASYFSGHVQELTKRAHGIAMILKPCATRQEAEDWCMNTNFTWPTE